MSTKKMKMNKIAKSLLFSGAFLLGMFGLNQAPVNAATPANANGMVTAFPGEAYMKTLCPPNKPKPEINKLVADMRIPKKITIDGINGGNPISLNETYLHDGCMVVYGNASYIKNGMTGKNKRSGAYHYIDYSIGSAKKVNGVDFGVNKAILYSNMAFPDDEGGGPGYLATRKFAPVKKSAKASKLAKNMTEAQSQNGARVFKLNRAWDKYYENQNDLRGDFANANDYTKRNWEGRFLTYYADAIDPILKDEKVDKYQPLTFRMYKSSGWYSTWTTVPSMPEVCYDIGETDPRKKCKGTPPPPPPLPPPDFIIDNNCPNWDMKMKDQNGVWQTIHFGDPLIAGREVKFGVKYTTKNVTQNYPQMPVSWAWQDRVMSPDQNPNKWGWWWDKKPIGPPGGMMGVNTGTRANTWIDPPNGPPILNEQLVVPTKDLEPSVLATGRIRLKVNINYGNGKAYSWGPNTGEPNEVNFANNYSFCTFPYVPAGDAIVSMDAKKIVQDAAGDNPLDGSDVDPAKYIKEDENDIDEAALNNYDYPGTEYLDNPDLAEEAAADGGIATDTNEPDFNDIAGNPSFKPDMPITIPVTVTNQLAKKISAPCVTSEAGCAPNSGTVDVSPRPGTGLPRDKMRVWLVNVTNEGDDYQLRFDPNGTVIYNRQDAAFATGQRFIEVNMPTIDPKKDFTYQFKISGLPPGKYEAYAEIPYYQNETNYKNNRAMLMFEVNEDEMLNMKCRSVYIDGAEQIEFNTIKKVPLDEGKRTKIDKICYGMVPKYPSTKVEGGQGTYFYFMYRFFPVPFPQYHKVSGEGLNQTYLLIEPKDRMGDVSGPATSDKAPLVKQIGDPSSFIYWPNKDGQSTALTGPYRLGPHGYHHYAYRGRLFATKVNFRFDVYDPMFFEMAKGNSEVATKAGITNIDQTRLATGEVDYTIPKDCFDENILDYKDKPGDRKCRQVFFYLPAGGDPAAPNPKERPAVEQRLQFKNPGYHLFRLYAKETQFYRYEKDDYTATNAGEWQGKRLKISDMFAPIPQDLQDPLGAEPGSNDNQESTTPERMMDENGNVVNAPKRVPTTITNGNYIPNENIKNRCVENHDSYNSAVTEKTVCFHDHSMDYHWWKFNWTQPKWLTNPYGAGGTCTPPAASTPGEPPARPKIENGDNSSPGATNEGAPPSCTP